MPQTTPRTDNTIHSPAFVPYNTGPGLVDPQQTGMQGIDMTGPGLGEQYTEGAVGYYAGGNLPGLTQNTQTYFDQFQANRPQIATDPGLEPYYDNAMRQAREGIDSMSASRGAYGSSAALGLGAEAATNLAAERANREADYNLRRLGEERQWESLGGSLAGSADAGALSASADERAWTMGLGDLALAGQDATRTRGQDYFGNQMAMAGTMEGLMADEYGGMFADDRSLMDASMGAELGMFQDQTATMERLRQQKEMEDAAERAFAADIIKTGLTAGAGYGG